MDKEYLHGFITDSSTRVEEIAANIIKMTHKKSGAKLIFIDREDENKTFAIGFKTIPTDDTGVFHILEHTVLAGSEHFPVKDPMTALLSSSLYTYLNAFTYPDKTVYPVSSKNNKAFLDLVNVYMDAVLHPLVLKNKSIFMSEGHHLEYTEDGRLDISGIVYNEMKGAYASADELMEHYLSKNLYTGGTYSYDSGGYPDAIPSLTYEKFLEAHKRFYHPDNSIIILDGSVEIEKVLALLDSYLKDYGKSGLSFNVDMGRINTEPVTEYYPISKDENIENKSRLAIAYPAFSHSDYKEHIAMSAIVDSIADTNSSPLKSKILASGLCENMYIYYNASSLKSTLTVQFLNVKDGKEEELLSLFDKTAREIARNGIDKERLAGSLNIIEFKTREADFGSFPRGMVYMLSAMEYALYGEDAECAFAYGKSFAELKALLDTEYFNDLLKTVLRGKRVTVLLKPDSDLSEKANLKLRASLDKITEEMTKEQSAILDKELSDYEGWQSTPDSPEALAAIPTLEISDIGPSEPCAPTEVFTLDGATVIAHDIETSGILYTDMYFDVSDADEDTMHAMRVFSSVMPELDTEYSSADKFRSKLKHTLGDLSVSLSTEKNNDKTRLYLTVRSSALVGSFEKLCELLDEYIYQTVYDAESKIKQKLTQLYTSSHEGITADGLSIALTRSAVSLDDLSYLNDLVFGYGYHKYLKASVANTDTASKKLIPKFTEIRNKYLRRERLTLAVTAKNAKKYANKLVSVIKTGGISAQDMNITRPNIQNEGVNVQSTVGYSALSASFKRAGLKKYRGSLSVLGAIISYELLWGKIRVKGGAYDTGFTVKGNSGIITAYSYRDPSPVKSYEYFKTLISDVREIIPTLDLSKYVISTIGATDTVSTPRSSSLAATVLFLNGLERDYKERVREEMLATDKEELMMLCDIIERALESSAVCITAPEKLLEGLSGLKLLDI